MHKFFALFNCLYSSWCNLPWSVSVIGLNSRKFFSPYLGQFSCKVQILEKDGACLFLAQDFVYPNKSLAEEWLFFAFLIWKINLLHMRRKFYPAYLNRNWSNTMMLPIVVFVGSPISKNRLVIVWKGCHNVIHFSIIGNF